MNVLLAFTNLTQSPTPSDRYQTIPDALASVTSCEAGEAASSRRRTGGTGERIGNHSSPFRWGVAPVAQIEIGERNF